MGDPLWGWGAGLHWASAVLQPMSRLPASKGRIYSSVPFADTSPRSSPTQQGCSTSATGTSLPLERLLHPSGISAPPFATAQVIASPA